MTRDMRAGDSAHRTGSRGQRTGDKGQWTEDRRKDRTRLDIGLWC